MPELPEVETVRRGLEGQVVGATITSVRIDGSRTLRRHMGPEDDFAARLTGRTVVAAKRRGKFLWLPLDDAAALVVHLGMSGQLRVHGPSERVLPHTRARFGLNERRELRFVDQRTFGSLAVVDDGEPVPRALAHIAPDPFDASFDMVGFSRALRHRGSGIKAALLDQRLVSGVGNIYADEALWRSRLHWARPCTSLRAGDVRELIGHVRDVLVEAIAAGGTSFDALYVSVNGESGWFDRSLSAYGQAGEPCPRCATPIVREPFANRSSYRCPSCQRSPRNRVKPSKSSTRLSGTRSI